MAIPDLLHEMIHYFKTWPSQTESETEAVAKLVEEMETLGEPGPLSPNRHPVLDDWFAHSVAAPTTPRARRLIDALVSENDHLHWVTGRTHYISQQFSANYSFAQIIGHGTRASSIGLYASQSIAIGFSLQAPGLFYPPHYHAAVEFYGVLSGTARWQRESNPPELKPGGSSIFHETNVIHAMETLEDPLLNIWAWTGDMSGKTMFSSETWL